MILDKTLPKLIPKMFNKMGSELGKFIGALIGGICRTGVIAYWKATWESDASELTDLAATGTHDAGDGVALLFDGVGYGTVDLTGYEHLNAEVWTIEFEFNNSVAIDDASTQQQVINTGFQSFNGILFGAFTGSLSNEIITVASDAGGTGRSGYTSATESISVGKHSIIIQWSGTTYDIYLDGVKVNNATAGTESVLVFDLLNIGASSDTTRPLNNTSLNSLVLKNQAGTVIYSNKLAQGGTGTSIVADYVDMPPVELTGLTMANAWEEGVGGYDWGLEGYSEYENLAKYSEPINSSEAGARAEVTVGVSTGGLANFVVGALYFGDNSIFRQAVCLSTSADVEHNFSVYVEMDDGSAPVVTQVTNTGDFLFTMAGEIATVSVNSIELVNGSDTVYKISLTGPASGADGQYGMYKYTGHSSKGFHVSRYHLTEVDGNYIKTDADAITGKFSRDPRGIDDPLGIIICFGDSLTINYVPFLAELYSNSTLVDEGVGGNSLAMMAARFQVDVVDAGADHVIIFGGANDLAGGVLATNMQANIVSMVELAIANGINVILSEVSPWGAHTLWTSAKQTETESFNTWINSYGLANGYEVAGMYAAMQEGSTDSLKTVYDNGDGLHFNSLGSKAEADLFDPLLPSTFNHTQDVLGNTLTNPGTGKRNMPVWGRTVGFDGVTSGALASAVTLSGDCKIETQINLSSIAANTNVTGGASIAEGLLRVDTSGRVIVAINSVSYVFNDVIISIDTEYKIIFTRSGAVGAVYWYNSAGVLLDSQSQTVDTSDIILRYFGKYQTYTSYVGTLSQLKLYNASNTLVNHWVMEGSNVDGYNQIIAYDVVGGNDATFSGYTLPIYDTLFQADGGTYLAQNGGRLDSGNVIPKGATTDPLTFTGPHTASPEGTFQWLLDYENPSLFDADGDNQLYDTSGSPVALDPHDYVAPDPLTLNLGPDGGAATSEAQTSTCLDQTNKAIGKTTETESLPYTLPFTLE